MTATDASPPFFGTSDAESLAATCRLRPADLLRTLLALLCLLSLGACATGGGTVVIDAGHGGFDRGAVGFGRQEKDLTLDTAKRLKSALEFAGIPTVMTRSTDVFIPLGQRAVIGNSKGSIFVSVHYNCAPNASASGLETYYRNPNSERLARNVQSQIIRSTGRINRGVKTANFAVLRHSTIRAILVECGFISNSTECALMGTASYRQKIADAIARGIKANLDGLPPPALPPTHPSAQTVDSEQDR